VRWREVVFYKVRQGKFADSHPFARKKAKG
jgi:hypothetical protein